MKDLLKIIIADDHPVFRRGLFSIISSSENLEIIGEAENGSLVIELLKTLKPDIIILDIDMPIMDGVETAKFIALNYPNIKTIFLSVHKDKDILNSMERLNVKGYVLKDSAVIEIVDCIYRVADNEKYLSPEISKLIKPQQKKNNLKEENLNLTTTELKILSHICDAKTNKEIAQIMFLSVRTIENHRFNICSKLGIKGNHALLKFALENKHLIHHHN